MIDLSALPDGTPVWLVTCLVIIMSLLAFSERLAKIRGPLGSLSRWWSKRQSDEIDRIQAANDRIEEAAERRYGRRLKELEDAIGRLSVALEEERKERRRERKELADRYEIQVHRIQQERDLFAAWAEHILSWWRGQAQWLAHQGIKLPPPPLPVFAEFRKQWLESHGPSTGARHTANPRKEG